MRLPGHGPPKTMQVDAVAGGTTASVTASFDGMDSSTGRGAGLLRRAGHPVHRVVSGMG